MNAYVSLQKGKKNHCERKGGVKSHTAFVHTPRLTTVIDNKLYCFQQYIILLHSELSIFLCEEITFFPFSSSNVLN